MDDLQNALYEEFDAIAKSFDKQMQVIAYHQQLRLIAYENQILDMQIRKELENGLD